ncbi:hypothetical protein OO258_21090 [Pseudomonas sp. DCB_BI]|uniref:hypothetical protein n=1 Tax=Pseudomonas sp. DCB_BI TaxID=2993594 RepID=UPI00224A94C1|nr:hypothetical protein [Pseudomonas sp. DCB_BI]MCX2890734.1 hypothetical protein [Pseudomonas sp. DCB_BI]
MNYTSVEQKHVQDMKRTPAKGIVTAVISLAGQTEDFVSQGVDFGTTEQYAWLYAYKGHADDADVYIDFDLELQEGVRDVVISGEGNRAVVHKRGTTYGGYAKSGRIRKLELTATSIKAEAFEFEGEDDLQRPFRVVGGPFEIYVIGPSVE